MAKGRFTGGSHTIEKVETVQAYATFFAHALNGQSFRRIYIDAFAGSGTFDLDHGDAGLFGDLVKHGKENRPGSAEYAVAVDPPFNEIYFIEKQSSSALALHEIAARHPKRHIEIRHGDANEEIARLCRDVPWRTSGGARAVLFLDPFGMSVDWSTVETIAETRAVDLWYLFPTAAVGRQLPYDRASADEHKDGSLDRILGPDWWRAAFYRRPEKVRTLFSDEEDPVAVRDAGFDAIESAFVQRLGELFPYVHPHPRRLKSKGVRTFSLVFAMANSEPKAIGLAQRALKYILPSPTELLRRHRFK